MGAFGFDQQAQQAEQRLREMTPMTSVGVAYLERGHELPVAQVAVDGWECATLVELGNWAREVLTAAGSDNVVEPAEGDELRRAWRDGPLVFVRHSNPDLERRLTEPVLV